MHPEVFYGSRRALQRFHHGDRSGSPKASARCACFCSENLYVARYGLHVRFRSEQQLRQDYEPVSGLYWLCRENELGAVVEEGPQSLGSFTSRAWPTPDRTRRLT